MLPWIAFQRRLWQLRANRRELQRKSRATYADAEKAGKSKEELWSIIEDRARHDRYIDEEVADAETSYLYTVAYHLRVPAPDYCKKDLWQDASYAGARRILTEAALSDFRASIRRERNERWQYWELRLKVLGVVFTGLTGAIGALIGLIAILQKSPH